MSLTQIAKLVTASESRQRLAHAPRRAIDSWCRRAVVAAPRPRAPARARDDRSRNGSRRSRLKKSWTRACACQPASTENPCRGRALRIGRRERRLRRGRGPGRLRDPGADGSAAAPDAARRVAGTPRRRDGAAAGTRNKLYKGDCWSAGRVRPSRNYPRAAPLGTSTSLSEYPRRSRGGAATRPHGISPSSAAAPPRSRRVAGPAPRRPTSGGTTSSR